jgi:two-component system sensor histidine kinase BaeS
MTLQSRLFLAILLVSSVVAAAIVAFSIFVTGNTLHAHSPFGPEAAPTTLTGPMKAVVSQLQAEIRARGVEGIRSIAVNPPVAIRWNVALVTPNGTIEAASQVYLRGIHVRRDDSVIVLSKPSGATISRVAAHMVLQATLSAEDGRVHNAVLFLPNGQFVEQDPNVIEARLRELLWMGALVAVLASGLASAALAAYLVRPLRALRLAAGRMAEGDLSVRVPITGDVELKDLAAAFNRTAEKLERAERSRTEMTSDIAHELRSPLNSLHVQLEAIREGILPASTDRINALIDESEHLTELVADLQQLTLFDTDAFRIRPEALSPFELLRSVAAKFEGAAKRRDVVLAIRCDPEAEVYADVRGLRHIVLNLTANALRHARSGGHVELSSTIFDRSVEIAVTDDGAGIPDAHLERIFDRFFRIDGARSRDSGGTGLGLAIAKRLVEAHGGTIRAENVMPSGARISFTVPQRGALAPPSAI